MTLRVLIAGGGRVGTALADRLLLVPETEVVVVDGRAAVLGRLRRRLDPRQVAAGDVTDVGALERAGIRRMDVVAAVTGIDEMNLVVAGLARFHFDVPRTVARIVDPARAWLYTPEMGVDVALDQVALLAGVVAMELGNPATAVPRSNHPPGLHSPR